MIKQGMTGVVALVVAGMWTLGGCASTSPPKVTVTAAQVSDRTGEGVAMQFVLDAENANDSGLPLRTVTYTLELGGKPVFEGTRSAEATLRRQGTQRVVLPAVVATGQGPTAGRVPFKVSGTITYIAPGQIAEILFDSGVRVPSTSFEGTGEIDLGA